MTVGRINGDFGTLGRAAVHYMHHSYPAEEMAALYRAADVMLVTSLRDGMNLVAKEYVAARSDLGGALVLSRVHRRRRRARPGPADQPARHRRAPRPPSCGRSPWTPARAVGGCAACAVGSCEHDVQRWADDFLGYLAMSVPSQRETV